MLTRQFSRAIAPAAIRHAMKSAMTPTPRTILMLTRRFRLNTPCVECRHLIASAIDACHFAHAEMPMPLARRVPRRPPLIAASFHFSRLTPLYLMLYMPPNVDADRRAQPHTWAGVSAVSPKFSRRASLLRFAMCPCRGGR